jgi:hypothetical protein
MLTTLEVIIIAAAGAVSFFLVAAVSIVLVLRAKDRQRRNEEEAARQFSNGQRVRSSVGSSDYSHIPEPMANLRRSTHLPYGIVSERKATISSQDTLAQQQTTLINDRPRVRDAISHQKRRRSLRASFSAHSFSLPKTRRQKKIERAIPLRTIPHSPLSAITEHSGTNTSQASPSVGIAELPTEITPKSTPARDDHDMPVERPFSLQWPLTTTERAPNTAPSTTIRVPASRNSTLMRMNTTGHGISPDRPPLGQRSISVGSTLSLAPEDPLPPLPSIMPNHWPAGRKSRLRLSAASVDTIGSSVLGGGQTSPSQTETDLTSLGLGMPTIDLNPSRLQSYDRESQDWGLAAVITTGSPKARHATKYRSGKAGYGSLRASIANHSSLQKLQGQLSTDASDRSSLIPRRTGTTLNTIDASNWRAGLSSRANSVRASVSPSVVAALARTGSDYKKGTVAARHSMYEQNSSTGTFFPDPGVLRDVSGNPASPGRQAATSRPASIASENPFHWDRNSLQTGFSSTLKASPGLQRRGHKRQNCVRITNLPVVDTSHRASKLPQMTEEEEDANEPQKSKAVNIPGLSLLEQKGQIDNAVPGQDLEISPFLNRPMLEPTSWKRPNYSRAPSSESIVSCRRDFDVFRNARYDPSAPNIFAENSTTPRQAWPLSSASPYRSRAQPTPLSLKAIQEPLDPDSPTLPMPVISSATLFARAVPLGSRVSGVRGPRSFPIPGQSPRTISPSPVTARAATEPEDLRRSVVTLRRMNSDAKDKTRMSQLYCNIGDGSTSSLLDTSNVSDRTPVTQPFANFVDMSVPTQIPNAPKTKLQIPSTVHQRVSVSPSAVGTLTGGGLGFSKSRSKMATSPSVMSVGAASIWEDASVRGDSPEPELPISSKICSPQLVDWEAYENFAGQDKRSQKDKDRESKLTSPQGRGLGLTGVQIQSKVWGTPGSLYDGDGFLKE